MRASLLVLLIASGCTGGVRWRPYAPVRIHSGRSQASLVYLRMEAKLRELGYQVQQADHARRYLRVMARLDEEFVGAPQWSSTRSSILHVQIREDGSAEITATGRHLRREHGRDLIHYRLDEELRRLAAALEAAAGSPVRTGEP
jgi:hypothetical protein